MLGVYANLMTRGSVLQILKVARSAGWKTIVGGPEPGAYIDEYLAAGADVVVIGEGEHTLEELLPVLRTGSLKPTGSHIRDCILWRRREGPSHGASRSDSRHRSSTVAKSRIRANRALSGNLAHAPWHRIGLRNHRERMSLRLQLVQPCGVRENASAEKACFCGR